MSIETCPKCETKLKVDNWETTFDDQRYSGQCPACNTHLIATADVKISFELEIADLEDGVPSEYCDESVEIKVAQ